MIYNHIGPANIYIYISQTIFRRCIEHIGAEKQTRKKKGISLVICVVKVFV